MQSEFLNADQIRAATFVRHVEIHDTLGSTNDRAAELAREANIELPALVVARHQTAGRGRSQKTWWSADGALTFSLLLEPAAMSIRTANWPQLSLAMAVAICDALQGESPQAKLGIKWPNDVLLDGRKVSGILIESPGGPAPANDRLIVGIGININNVWRDVPRDTGLKGTSLSDATGRQHDLQAILVIILNAIADRIRQLCIGDPMLIRAWQELNLTAGEMVIVKADDHRIEGHCVEIAQDGALVVNTTLGCRCFYSGSVSIRNNQ